MIRTCLTVHLQTSKPLNTCRYISIDIGLACFTHAPYRNGRFSWHICISICTEITFPLVAMDFSTAEQRSKVGYVARSKCAFSNLCRSLHFDITEKRTPAGRHLGAPLSAPEKGFVAIDGWWWAEEHTRLINLPTAIDIDSYG